MSDQTSDMPMQDSGAGRSGRSLRIEFCVYFGIIFLAALPLAVVAWAIASLRNGALAKMGPVKRAWSQARIITPMIFSA